MLRRFLFFLSLTCASAASAQNVDYLNYIDRFKDIAISEMERAGVPASIKLAQALLESNAGKSTLARQANNHFGVKCGSDWTGKKYYREDDDYDENGELIKSCFREYRNAEDSYIAHSEFLRDPKKEKRYGFLFRLNPFDYRGWSYGLKQAGYATSANYHDKLIYIIETYELFRFDRMNSTDILAGKVPGFGSSLAGVTLNNDVKLVLAKAGDTPAEIANRTDVKVKCILKYNEGLNSPTQKLKENERVYIQPKRKAYRERKKYHYVQNGETMYDIAQLYGLKMKNLYSRNRLPEGTQPAVGERIKLRGWKVKRNEVPRLTTQVPPPPPVPPATQLPHDDDLDMEESDLDDKSKPTTTVPKPNPEDFTPEFPGTPKPDTSTVRPNTGLPETPSNTNTTTPANATQTHTVQKGDTLYSIAKKYGTTVDKIVQLNQLAGTTIKIGQQLKIK
ncbi:MAG TPA: LysM peptidoglycan-binding domain-containing protein [Saprospiraceae bacterium]|nr:LysM peptidoglycan-binding domain-containing protein [Saprospiraceae bacterium]